MRGFSIVRWCFGIALICFVASIFVSKPEIPSCELEDGSTQSVCVWSYTTPQGEARTLINHEFGEYTYYPETSTTIYWDNPLSATPERVKEAVK